MFTAWSRSPLLLLLSLGYFPAAPIVHDPLPAWVEVDSAAHTVSLTLEARRDSVTGVVSLNGFRRGGIQVVVPLSWTVRWHWLNADSTAHSLVVMAEREKLPLEGARPALDNAVSRNLLQGLKPGQKDESTFTADQAGWYWILCGVPGHAIAGEWIGLKVDREASWPGVVEKR
jgi:plastocyanin